MKKFLIVVLAFITTTTMFALPPPKVGNGPGSSHRSGPNLIPTLRKDITQNMNTGISKTPNRGVANAVVISGLAAIGARFIQDVFNPPQPTIIVLPEGTEGPIIIKEQEPVVKHPVPIQLFPKENLKSH